MQQRQLRLGDILDDYCPRERRLTNHAVVAMVGEDVKQTRCTTCEAEHEYKHAKVPRQRRKSEAPAALYAQVLAGGPKRVTHGALPVAGGDPEEPSLNASNRDNEPPQEATPDFEVEPVPGANIDSAEGLDEAVEPLEAAGRPGAAGATADGMQDDEDDEAAEVPEAEEGPVHRPLIRATLPRQENQPPPARPAPDFTIRQPGGRQNRFRPRHQRGGQMFQGNRPGGGGNSMRGGPQQRQNGGRPPQGSLTSRRHGSGGHGRKRSK